MKFSKQDAIEIGKRIHQIRTMRRLTMHEMAVLIGVPNKSAINNWEKGRNALTEERLHKIAQLGNTTLDWIINGIPKATVSFGGNKISLNENEYTILNFILSEAFLFISLVDKPSDAYKTLLNLQKKFRR